VPLDCPGGVATGANNHASLLKSGGWWNALWLVDGMSAIGRDYELLPETSETLFIYDDPYHADPVGMKFNPQNF